MRRSIWIVLVGLLVFGTGSKLKKLSEQELTHYYALRVFMDDGQQKERLKLKTSEDRDAWLKEKGLWERYYSYDQYDRDDMAAGEVKHGWKSEMVFMSWGAPFAKERLTGRPASRSERMDWRFEVQPDGSVLVWYPKSKTEYKAVGKYRMEVVFDDDVVTEITKKEGW